MTTSASAHRHYAQRSPATTPATATGHEARHPLAPLTPAEIALACAVVNGAGVVADGVRFVSCALHEPPKESVLNWDGRHTPRLVECVVYHRASRRTTVLVVSLETEAVVTSTDVPGAQPQILDEEWISDPINIKADTRFHSALARRGITDLSKIVIDPWPAGNFGLEVDDSGRRLARGVAYVIDDPEDNPYARPVENLMVVVDRDTGEVVEVHDGEVIAVPAGNGRYDAGSVGPLQAMAPLEITQPDGPGFALADGALEWGPWRLRLSMHPVEGLVLHDVRYLDGERLRPIVYRASLSEMVVPYGSTAMNHWWKCTFDAGEGGLGKLAGTLHPGCDCLGVVQYMDAVGVTEDGHPVTFERAICIHEEDFGILWKHRDARAGTSEVRRSRRLVVSFIATVGNYDYGFFWYFYVDGRLELEIKLTGIIQTQAVAPGTRVPYAHPVTPELAGPNHQHLFAFRLDMCVDGPRNSVYEVDAIAEPRGPANPYGNAFIARATLLDRESVAQRLAAPERGRYWQVVNPGSLNHCGSAVGYKVVPSHVAPPLLADPQSAVAKRAAFATKHLWVTAFEPSERHAAGDFPNQHAGGDGLPRWVAADRPLVDTNIVLWPTVGVTHFCRPEDYPVMPCAYTGFCIVPIGFFDRNPSTNLEPPSSGGHCAPRAEEHTNGSNSHQHEREDLQ